MVKEFEFKGLDWCKGSILETLLGFKKETEAAISFIKKVSVVENRFVKIVRRAYSEVIRLTYNDGDAFVAVQVPYQLYSDALSYMPEEEDEDDIAPNLDALIQALRARVETLDKLIDDRYKLSSQVRRALG